MVLRSLLTSHRGHGVTLWCVGSGGSRVDRSNGYIMARSGVLLNLSRACRAQYGSAGRRRRWASTQAPASTGISPRWQGFIPFNERFLLILLSEAITGFVAIITFDGVSELFQDALFPAFFIIFHASNGLRPEERELKGSGSKNISKGGDYDFDADEIINDNSNSSSTNNNSTNII